MEVIYRIDYVILVFYIIVFIRRYLSGVDLILFLDFVRNSCMKWVIVRILGRLLRILFIISFNVFYEICKVRRNLVYFKV